MDTAFWAWFAIAVVVIPLLVIRLVGIGEQLYVRYRNARFLKRNGYSRWTNATPMQRLPRRF